MNPEPRWLDRDHEAIGIYVDHRVHDDCAVIEFEGFSISIPLSAIDALRASRPERGKRIGVFRFDDIVRVRHAK